MTTDKRRPLCIEDAQQQRKNQLRYDLISHYGQNVFQNNIQASPCINEVINKVNNEPGRYERAYNEAIRMITHEMARPNINIINRHHVQQPNEIISDSYDLRKGYLENSEKKKKLNLVPGDSWLQSSVSKDVPVMENGSIQRYLNDIHDASERRSIRDCSRRIKDSPSLLKCGLAQIELKRLEKDIEKTNDRYICSQQLQVNYSIDKDRQNVII